MTHFEPTAISGGARLLIVEDDPGHAQAVRRALTAAGWAQVETVASLSAFRQRVSEQAPNLVLADLILPDGESIEILSVPAEAQPFPIVIMTSHGDEAKAVAALKAGAFDYIVKTPAAFVEMPNTLARIQREWALVQDRKAAAAERESLQQQLAQAQKMESIGRLAGGIAHDFNNMLGSILGYTELALSRCVPDRDSTVIGYLSNVQRAGERARDLVASMLAATRLNARDVQPLNIDYIVGEVTQFLRPILPASVRINFHANPRLPVVRLDANRLHQALTNLCVNARDAVKEHGTIELALDWLAETPAVCASCGANITGKWLALSVRDNGSGIEPNVVGKMFDPFYTTKGPGHGTGLGLSIVNTVTHEAGGHVLVKTARNQGTTITLLFPPSSEPNAEHTSKTTDVIASKGHGQRVLVVDDEASLAALLGETLAVSGYDPTVFTDSTAALKYFNQDPTRVDVLITDYTMPALTGGELARAILNVRPGLPIIMCTGYTDKMDPKSATHVGIAHYLHKPVPIAVLLQTLQGLVQTPSMAWLNE